MHGHEDDGLLNDLPLLAALLEEMCPRCGSDDVGYDEHSTPVCRTCGYPEKQAPSGPVGYGLCCTVNDTQCICRPGCRCRCCPNCPKPAGIT